MSVSAAALRDQIDYSAWASRRLLRAAAELTEEERNRDFGTADRSVVATLVHVFGADRLWLSRFLGSPLSYVATDADRNLAALETGWPALHQNWRLWAETLTDDQARQPLAYTDLRGNPWSQPLWQLVLHVVNHGTHHRGQVAGFLRAMGHTPPPCDLTVFYREKAAGAA